MLSVATPFSLSFSTSRYPQQQKQQGQQEVELATGEQQQQQQKVTTTTMMTVRVAAEEWVPHIAVSQDSQGNITIRGPMANLLTLLARALNFRCVVSHGGLIFIVLVCVCVYVFIP